MTYCRNFCSMLIVFLGISWIGCGEDVPTEPGEEIVTDKWIDPKDIGKEYSVPELDFGDTVTIETGERVTLTKNDFILFKDRRGYSEQQPFLVTTKLKPDPLQGEGWFIRERTERGFVVPEGDPIVSLWTWSDRELGNVTKDRSVKKRIELLYIVEIDRKLDYNLPIYLEYRTQDLKALGSQVHVIRFIGVVKKGDSQALLSGIDDMGLYVGDIDKHQKAYISILPHTEMKKIDLPATTGYPDGQLRPVEISAIPEGHTFRPYRIRSSSFLMAKPEIEDNW